MGGHTTRYGNYYTEQEWNAMTANFAAEDRDAEDYIANENALISQAAKMLEPIAGENAYGIAHKIFNYGIGGIEFSSEDGQELAETVDGWMTQEARNL